MSETELLFWIFTAISFVFFACYTLYTFFAYRQIDQSKRAFSLTVFYTVGVFVAVFMLFIPVYYTRYDFGDAYSFVRPILLSLHNTLRVFILDGEFDVIKEAVDGCGTLLHTVYSSYGAVLYVLAPVLTFGTVLSFFKNFNSEIRYRFCGCRDIYVFSELNKGSLALAKNIYNKFSERNPLLVFTDVYEKNEESNHELLLEAYNINAICLKKDVTRLNISAKKGKVEIFLIGEDESENVSHASLMTEQLNRENKKQNVKIFVFATGKEKGYIIDSLNYENLLNYAVAHDLFSDDVFRIRRINSVKQLVWRTVPKMELFEHCHYKTVSVMIAGIGSFGTELFKMLVWYCQREGYSLEINIFDKKKNIKSGLARQCPELFAKNPRHDNGDAVYDIRCYDGIDFSTDSFECLWEDSATANRLRKTSAVIVALGEDDTNIETSVYLRQLFDRKNGIVAEKNKDEHETPVIYSVVYDGTKTGTVTGNGNNFLKNYKKIPYQIRFIGSIAQQYEYDNIYDFNMERIALEYHTKWSGVEWGKTEEIIKSSFEQELMEKIFKRILQEKKNEIKDVTEEDEIEEKINNMKENIKDYERFEYCRWSSLAEAIHKNNLPEDCKNLASIEHIRWNAYMRTEGYSYGEKKAPRALLHNCLRDCDTHYKNNPGDKEKDCFRSEQKF